MDGDEDDLSELGAKWKTKPAHKLQYRPEVEMTECTIEEAVPMLSDLDNGNPVVEPESLYLIHVWGTSTQSYMVHSAMPMRPHCRSPEAPSARPRRTDLHGLLPQ